VSIITGRVQRGAALLDEHDPDWWRADAGRAIDLDRLDLAEGDTCVLGQRCPLEVAASYRTRAESEDEIDDPDKLTPYRAYSEQLFDGRWDSRTQRVSMLQAAHDHGFAWMGGERREFDELTAAWRDLIQGRRAQTGGTT
jgi:hypothetical protein